MNSHPDSIIYTFSSVTFVFLISSMRYVGGSNMQVSVSEAYMFEFSLEYLRQFGDNPLAVKA